ncbi:hypothetical protein GLP40_18620 [Nocardia sp. CT2-14]|uniref:FAD-binding domain-containing protein n=1 Tax=Nocardia aurantiaca TaxID=2675850 RepID=A0A6I3KVD7_9NOCA|nr:hypothetical protein [Nocardia aurantiaca]
MTTAHVPVLVAGGGLVGLSAALFLEYHGVPYVLVERWATASPLPRSRGLHTRTGEMYRQAGVEAQILAAASALRAGKFGGAWTGESVRTAESLDLSGRDVAHGRRTGAARHRYRPGRARPAGGRLRDACRAGRRRGPAGPAGSPHRGRSRFRADAGLAR